MNIKILDSWLRDYLKTDAKPKEIADILSLTSVSIDKLEKVGSDYIYDVEIMTNRVDLACVTGLAREAAAVLNHAGYKAEYVSPSLLKPENKNKVHVEIKNDPSLVNRVCAVVMDVAIKQSPKEIQERLEATDIRTLNNLIDITNYVMRTIGHPTHVFDFDRIGTGTLLIREAKKGEEIVTLDGKKHVLDDGDLVADDGTGRIVDLLGIMGLANSVVTENTKRILFFIDNNETTHMRKTSMNLGIRTEAAQMNEKGIDSERAYDALLYGIKLYEEFADGKVVSELVDIYPNKPKKKEITVREESIQKVIGVPVTLKTAKNILVDLGFGVETKEDKIIVTIPSERLHEMNLSEDVIEEIARVYGYHNIPSLLPDLTGAKAYQINTDEFYWEERIKSMMKYYGYTELYTYSMISGNMYEGELTDAVRIQNPLNEDMVYMRNSLILSLLQVINENKKREVIEIYEIANIYKKKHSGLPEEERMFSGVSKRPHNSFFKVKGLLEQVLKDIGITKAVFTSLDASGGAEISIDGQILGEIDILDNETVTWELSFDVLLNHVTRAKTYTSLPKYPPVYEDMAVIAPENITVGQIMQVIEKQSSLIKDVSLLDKYHDVRTFHITYQHKEKNLTSEDITPIREKILTALKHDLQARLKE